GDRGAGVAAVPGPAALLHPGPVAWERQGMRIGWAVAALLCLLPSLAQAQEALSTRVLDDFEDASAWRVVTSNQVSGALRAVEGVDGRALCLDYDFNGVSGYAGIQRDLAIEYPENYRFDFQLRG